jgi:hypothetical protein
MSNVRLFVRKLDDENVQRLYVQANQLSWLSVSELLNFIVSTALDRLEELNDPDEWDDYELVSEEEI